MYSLARLINGCVNVKMVQSHILATCTMCSLYMYIYSLRIVTCKCLIWYVDLSHLKNKKNKILVNILFKLKFCSEHYIDAFNKIPYYSLQYIKKVINSCRRDHFIKNKIITKHFTIYLI